MNIGRKRSSEFETRPGLTYATHDSVALAGDLYLPKGAGPFPVLVGVHGGGWVQGARGAVPALGAVSRGARHGAVRDQLPAGQGEPEDLPARGAGRAGGDAVRARQRQGVPTSRRTASASSAIPPAATSARSRRSPGESALFASGYPQDPHAKESTEVKVFAGVYGVYDVAEMWQKYNAQSPKQNNIEWFLGASLPDNRQLYFDASPISYAITANNKIAVHLSVGTEDDLVDRKAHTDAFVLALKQAGFFVRTTHPAGRAALLGQRSDRRAGQLLRLPRAAADAVPGGETVTQ